MSWSDKLKSTAGEGSLGKLWRRWTSDDDEADQPAPARFEPRSASANGGGSSAFVSSGFETAPSAKSNAPRSAPPPSSPPLSESWRAGGSTAVALALKQQPIQVQDGPRTLPDFAPGDVMAGNCEIEKVLHRNRRFVVYAARHLTWNTRVALKAPAEDLLSEVDLLEEITDAGLEWVALGLHPHVVYCHYVQLVGGAPVLVLEHVDGGDLRPWVAAGRTANLRVGLNLAIQLCHGLEHLHGAAVRHGALMPSNVLVTRDGMVKIGNVGPRLDRAREATNAKSAAPRNSGGSERAALDQYRAPELWVETPEHDVGADVFALGVCLYEMFCGHRPYEVARGPRREPAAPRFASTDELIPERLGRLLARCVDWERERRPAAAEVRAELTAAYEDMFGRVSPFADLPGGSCTADGLNNQALAATVLGDLAGADAAWQNALQTAPLHPLATYNLAVARWRRGEITDQAVVRYMERARSALPGDWRATEGLALVHLERGESAAALTLLEEAAAKAPAGVDLHETLARLRAAAPADHRTMLRLRGHAGFVSAASFGDGGRAVFSAGDDGTLRVWDLASGRLVRTLEAHNRRTSSLSTSADGELALSASDDGTVKLWDMRTGRCVKTILAGGAVFCASLSADGTRVAASSTGSDNFLGIDSTLLQVWDVTKERCLGKLVGHTAAAKAISLSPDGLTVATGGDDHTVRVWEVSGACKKVMDGHVHYVSCVLLAADNEHLLSGSWDQTMRLWQIKSGRCVRVFGKSGAIVTSVAMTPDCRIAVSGCWDGTVRVWEVATGRCIRTFQAHSRMVTSVSIDPSASIAVSSSWDATVCVHHLRSIPLGAAGACVPRLSVQPQYARLPSPEPEPEELVEAADRALREGKIAVALDRIRRARAHPDVPAAPDDAARLWRELSRHCRRTSLRAVWKSASWAPEGRIDTFRPLGDSSRVLLAGEAGLHSWEIDLNRNLRKFQGHTARVVALAVSADGRSALSGSADGTLRWWDVASGARRVAMEGHGSIVAAVALSADETQAISASYDHTVRLWALNDGRCLHELQGHRRQVTAVAAGVGGWLCASGDYEGRILLWSEDGAPIELEGHTGRVTGLVFAADGMRLVSSSCDGTLRLWDLAARRCARSLGDHNAPVIAIDCSADRRWCVSSAANGSLRLWDLESEASYELADEMEGGGAVFLAEEDRSVLVTDRRGLQVFELEWELEVNVEKIGPSDR